MVTNSYDSWRKLKRLDEESKALRAQYLDATTAPREQLVKWFKEALVVNHHLVEEAWNFTEASRLADMELVAIKERINGAKGGVAKARVSTYAAFYAVELAQKSEPITGWASAPQAAAAIIEEVNAFARTKGRRFSQRKVEEWLRKGGIKKKQSKPGT